VKIFQHRKRKLIETFALISGLNIRLLTYTATRISTMILKK